MPVLFQNSFHSCNKLFKCLVHNPCILFRIIAAKIADIICNHILRNLFSKNLTASALDFLNNRNHGLRESLTFTFHRNAILHMHDINRPGTHIHNQIFTLHTAKPVCHCCITLRKCQYIFNSKLICHILKLKMHRLASTLQILYELLSYRCKLF